MNNDSSPYIKPDQPGASLDALYAELKRLREENGYLRDKIAGKSAYIRTKTNELLGVMGTQPLKPEELDDETLVDVDPIGIISSSIKHVLENLKETNHQLHIVNENTSAIFAAAEVGILVIDGRKKILSCNNKLRELFFPDKDLSAVIGSYCSDEVCRHNRPKEGCACEMIQDGRGIGRIESWKYGDRIFNVVATPIKNEDGELADVVVVYNEITELKTAEEQLSHLNAELESRIRERTVQLELANNELETFCYTVSHDLRAPLRHIKGFANILSEECANSLNELGIDCLKRISNASSRMSALIDDLLHLSRVSKLEIRHTNYDLSRSAEKIIAMFRDTEPNRNVRTFVEPGLIASGDATLLDLVLQNLIGNAWKYSSENPEAVIKVGKDNSKGKQVFYVRDNGVGFDMAYSKKLFQVFERLHGDEFEGTGIGLATVKRVIARHGGRIWAEAAVGEGATFYFTLPEIKKS
ncbi:cyanobacterial phytochrome B [Geobacter sp. OR-1]|uniref:ATP-binding protein n=1 Tax=Geobacter sp. OR-1 TaxID=1266765 RepID=UPI000541AEDE|nr:ATP-binding protein [Geobacter sp. OR-1]GAM10842.1 cyanobacterial phytochrome B [Geobacter sp. OR-1]